jgi:hypothetical protein
MSLTTKRSNLCFLIIAALLPSAPALARIVTAPGCEAAQKLSDGSWLVRSPTHFGRGGPVDTGAIVFARTVINGVDLGADLERRCVRRYRVEPDYDSWLWPPNGFWSSVTPLQ